MVSSSDSNGSMSQVGCDMSGESKVSEDCAGLMSVSMGEIGG